MMISNEGIDDDMMMRKNDVSVAVHVDDEDDEEYDNGVDIALDVNA